MHLTQDHHGVTTKMVETAPRNLEEGRQSEIRAHAEIGEGTIVIKVIGSEALTDQMTSMRNEALAGGHLPTHVHVHHVDEMLGRLRGDVLANGRLDTAINVDVLIDLHLFVDVLGLSHLFTTLKMSDRGSAV